MLQKYICLFQKYDKIIEDKIKNYPRRHIIIKDNLSSSHFFIEKVIFSYTIFFFLYYYLTLNEPNYGNFIGWTKGSMTLLFFSFIILDIMIVLVYIFNRKNTK